MLLREGERKQKQVEKQKRSPGRRKKEEESGATKKMKHLLENWRKQTPESRTRKEKIQVKTNDPNIVVVRKQGSKVEKEVEAKKTVEEVVEHHDKPEQSQVIKPSEKLPSRRSVSSIRSMFSQAAK